jgi:ribosome biogenesis GTPase
MRELQIVDSEEGIKTTFSDIERLADKCRFKDCSHKTEPGCRVIEAVKTGMLEQRRLDNYHKLLSEQLRNNESLAERRSNDRALGRFYKSALKSSRKFKSRE